MPRTPATLPEGVRITDHISLGVIAKTFPRETVDEVLEATGRSSERERSLPAHVMVYYVIAMIGNLPATRLTARGLHLPRLLPMGSSSSSRSSVLSIPRHLRPLHRDRRHDL